MTDQQAKSVVKLLLASYPTQRQRMSDADVLAMMDAYGAALSQLEDLEVRAAVTALVLTERWIPTIAEIVAKVADLRHGAKREGGAAWGDVTLAMRRYGSHRCPGVDFAFEDPITERVVKAFGWRDLCASENQAADRARFIELYAQLASADQQVKAVHGALPGAAFAERAGGVRSLASVVRLLEPPDEPPKE